MSFTSDILQDCAERKMTPAEAVELIEYYEWLATPWWLLVLRWLLDGAK